MNKKELKNKVEDLKKEVSKFYKYDFEKLNEYCRKMYIGIRGKEHTVKYMVAMYTSLKYLKGLTNIQVDKICNLYYFERLLKISEHDKIYINKTDINFAYTKDDIGIMYEISNSFEPRRLSDLKEIVIINNTYELI